MKRKKINRKFVDKMNDRITDITEQILNREPIGPDRRSIYEQMSRKERKLLREFLEMIEADFKEWGMEMDECVDDKGNMKPKPVRRRRKPKTENAEPPKSLSDLPPLSSILMGMFRSPLSSVPPPKPKDQWPEEIDA